MTNLPTDYECERCAPTATCNTETGITTITHESECQRLAELKAKYS